MPDNNRGWFDQTVRLFFLIAILVAIVTAIFNAGLTTGINRQSGKIAANHYASDSVNVIKRKCSPTTNAGFIECATAVIKSSNEEQRSQHDLVAQSEMGQWAFWMMWASWATVGVTALGVWWVKRTLEATLEMANQANLTTAQTIKANKIALNTAIVQQRAWISFKACNIKLTLFENVLYLLFEFRFGNNGLTPAIKVRSVYGPPDGEHFLDGPNFTNSPIDGVIAPNTDFDAPALPIPINRIVKSKDDVIRHRIAYSYATVFPEVTERLTDIGFTIKYIGTATERQIITSAKEGTPAISVDNFEIMPIGESSTMT